MPYFSMAIPVSYTHLDVYKRQGYKGGMDQMLEIPKDRKPTKSRQLCVMMGLTALLFIAIALGVSERPAPVEETTQN